MLKKDKMCAAARSAFHSVPIVVAVSSVTLGGCTSDQPGGLFPTREGWDMLLNGKPSGTSPPPVASSPGGSGLTPAQAKLLADCKEEVAERNQSAGFRFWGFYQMPDTVQDCVNRKVVVLPPVR
jgi:hypothetical protein